MRKIVWIGWMFCGTFSAFGQSDCSRWSDYLIQWRSSPQDLIDINSNGLIEVLDLVAWTARCNASCSGSGIPSYPAVTVSAEWVRFQTWVDNAITNGNAYGYRALDAAIVYRETGNTAYRDEAIAVVDAFIQAELTLINTNQRPEVTYDSYLYAGDILGDVATVFDWCQSALTPTQISQWTAYCDQTLFNIWNPDDAVWNGNPFPWSGWSINNPGNNYFYSFVEATLLWALASDNSTWMDYLCSVKWPQLQAYFAQLDGGGSREGTGYGTSHMRLFELFRIWKEATGQDLTLSGSHARDSILYWLHATVPTLDYFAPIGDQARVSDAPLYDYHRNLVLRLLDLFPGSPEAGQGAWWLNHIVIDEMTSGFNLRHELKPVTEVESVPTQLYYHATGVGHLFARTNWTTNAVWLGVVAGPYEESHAHRDQGAFMLYQNGWLAVTQNIHSHSGIQQDAEVHNVVRFSSGGNTFQPTEGTTSSMSATSDASGLHIQADLSPAFATYSEISSWTRQLDFQANTLHITDQFSVDNSVTAVWQVNVPDQPVMVGNEIHAGRLIIRPIAPASPTISFLDWTTVDADHLSGWKVTLSGSQSGYEVELEVGP
ncbi:MAG: hypothetical protein H6510_16795 [Acidobacteria bacterium]|nr:hypothetical protein [Acidobacteriota bacterium]MCB9399472.1 hypothetical protein [Acidobacteriota bacterium]